MSIRRYLDQMLAAGLGIAGPTGAILKIDQRLGTAGAMGGVAGQS
jgi:hypothetical protein